MNLEFCGVILILNYLRMLNYLDEEFNGLIKLSLINFWIVILVFILYLIILIVEIFVKFRLNYLLIILIIIIRVSSILIFFILYEIIFILIIFVILLLGYSYERLLAGFLIIFYSFLFSSPVLIIILIFDHSFLIKIWLNYNMIVNFFFIGSFIVKFPIFGFHYWLPVAHVEASTIGSILLAGILLKIGSVGLYYSICYLNFFVKFHWLVLGVILTILIILNLRDLKIIIAYSSIAHISLVFYVINLGWNVGIKGRIIMIFYHGFVSPIMFWLVGRLAWWKTRSLIVVKIMVFSYCFILCVFLLIILNIGFPPFLGFLREILIFKALIINDWVLYVIILSILLRCYYNIYLFWCFNGVSGIIFKLSFFYFDIFGFLIFRLILNFF